MVFPDLHNVSNIWVAMCAQCHTFWSPTPYSTLQYCTCFHHSEHTSLFESTELRFCPPVSCRSLHLFACETRGDQVVNDFPNSQVLNHLQHLDRLCPFSARPPSLFPGCLFSSPQLPLCLLHRSTYTWHHLASLGIISYCFLGVLHHCMRILTIKRDLKDFISLEILLTLQGNHR